MNNSEADFIRAQLEEYTKRKDEERRLEMKQQANEERKTAIIESSKSKKFSRSSFSRTTRSKKELARSSSIDSLRHYVVKANSFVQVAKTDLTLMENRILNYLISKIKPEDKVFKPFIFSIEEFCETMGITSNYSAYFAFINNVVKRLKDKSIWFPVSETRITTANWIDNLTIDIETRTIEITLGELLTPLLLDLKGNYYQFTLSTSLSLNSVHSALLYELCLSHLYENEFTILVEDLQEFLTKAQYGRYYDFKKNVLLPAIEEINEFTEINISFTQKRFGRRIGAIEFEVARKSKEDETLAKNRQFERWRKRKGESESPPLLDLLGIESKEQEIDR